METDVLIVGAGPAGLATGVTLAGYGIETLLVDERERRSDLPRATVISTRSMELLRGWGLEAEIRARGVDVEWLCWVAPTLAEVAAGTPYEVGMPTRAQAAVVSPTAPLAAGQDQLESVLLDHFLAQPSTSAILGTAVAMVEGNRVTLADGRTIAARYIVGADGWRSTVREQLGIAMRGEDNLAAALTAEFHAPLWPVLGEHRYGMYATTTASARFYPAGADDRWLVGLDITDVEGAVAAHPPERVAEAIRAASGLPDLQPRVGRIGAFSFATRIAERFRQGDTFLVGDAAHRVTPRGGTGMNLAIHDGFDLGWRLAFVLLGWTDPGLLDRYETQRRPVAEHNVARSATATGSLRAASEGLDADLGGRIRHLWLAPNRSTVDALGPGLTRFGAPGAAVEGRLPVTTVELEPFQAWALGIPAGSSLLVGPDGHRWPDRMD